MTTWFVPFAHMNMKRKATWNPVTTVVPILNPPIADLKLRNRSSGGMQVARYGIRAFYSLLDTHNPVK